MKDALPSNVIALRTQSASAYTLAELMNVASWLAKSNLFKDIRSAEAAFAKIIIGRDLGLDLYSSLTALHIVEGRPEMDATLMAAQIKRSGRYDFEIKESDDKHCSIDFFSLDKATGARTLLGNATFDETQAIKAGLLTKDNWKKYPTDMYRARAMSRGTKWFCPDVFGAPVYVSGELEDPLPGSNGLATVTPITNPNAGETIDGTGTFTALSPPPTTEANENPPPRRRNRKQPAEPELATPRQLHHIAGLATKQDITTERLEGMLHERFGQGLETLTKPNASLVIDGLRAHKKAS
jgi:hypothetical protein